MWILPLDRQGNFHALTADTLVTYPHHNGPWDVQVLAWSPAGTQIASATSTVRVWDAMTGQGRCVYAGHAMSPFTGVLSVAWSPDGTRIASAGGDGTVQVWDAYTGETIFVYRGHAGPVTAVAWSPDGQRLASAGEDRTVQVWRVSARESAT